MSVPRTIRSAGLNAIDRSERASSLVRATAARYVAKRGVPAVLVEQVRCGDLPTDRALQLAQWGSAAVGRGSFPRHFSPGDHLLDESARRAAASLLRSHRDINSDSGLRRQLINVDDAQTLDDALAAVLGDLDDRLGTAAISPKGATPPLDPMQQTAIVHELSSTLEAVGVTPFLMAGSLLGLIRDGGLMSHDYDIDLGLLPGVDTDVVIGAVERLGSYQIDVIGPRIECVHSSGVRADLFAFEREGGWFWHATKIHRWRHTPFELAEADLGGRTIRIPSDPEVYLEENYGIWQHPIACYDMSFDTPNREYTRSLDAVRYLHTRCVRGVESNDRWALESAVRELRDQFQIDLTGHLAPTGLLQHDARSANAALIDGGDEQRR